MIYTIEQWERDNDFKAQPGQQIAPEIYDQLLNLMPPRRLPRAKYPIAVGSGFMVNEAYTHAEVHGMFQAFYAAFGRNGEACYFLGYYSAIGDKLPDEERKWGEIK